MTTALSSLWGFHTASAYTAERPPQLEAVAPSLAPALPGPALLLPQAALAGTITLQEALGGRRTKRTFIDAPVTLTELSAWLREAAASQQDGPAPGIPGRPYPSAGAIYPTRLYLALRNVDGAAPGVYAYDPSRHALHLVSQDVSALPGALSFHPDPQLACASVVAFVTGHLSDTTLKYGARGYRFALQESGHLGQNLLLVAFALGLEALPLGSFQDDRSAQLLHLEAEHEQVLYAVVLGRSARPDVERERPVRSLDHWEQWRLFSPDPLILMRALDRHWSSVFAGAPRPMWFLLKGDGGLHARLRVQPAEGETPDALRAQVDPLLAELHEQGLLARFTRSTYEAESGLFGGPAAMQLTHRLFVADSQLALQAQECSSAHRPLVSQVWGELLLRSLSLDPFERWDVWRQVRRFRPGHSERWAEPATRLRPVLQTIHGSTATTLTRQLHTLLPDTPPLVEELRHWGDQMQDLHRDGGLDGGLRAIAARCLLFHWNRFAFDPAQQAFLAQLRQEISAPDAGEGRS